MLPRLQNQTKQAGRDCEVRSQNAKSYCNITGEFIGSFERFPRKDNNQCSTSQIKPVCLSQNKRTPRKKETDFQQRSCGLINLKKIPQFSHYVMYKRPDTITENTPNASLQGKKKKQVVFYEYHLTN